MLQTREHGVSRSSTVVFGSGAAFSHPHIFAEARLDLTVENGTVQSLRHLWRFDEMFSSTVIVEFDKNADLALDTAELETVAETIHASLADFNYFQVVTAGGKDIEISAPPKRMASFEDSQLIVLFETKPKNPLKVAGKVTFGIYDPTFYTAIEFTEDKHLQVAGLPDGCTSSVVRPNPDEALAQNQKNLTEAFFNDPAGTNMSKIFATRFEIVC
ncbi:DUF1007 family protein [Phyllobacterium sp. LjRoot231]